MSTKQWNWRLWVGLCLSVAALVSYFLLFVTSRGFFWLSLVLFVVAAALLVGGLRRAYRQPESYRGKVAGPIVTVVSVLFLAGFSYVSYEVYKHFPAAENAPRLGQKAPGFTLPDSSGTPITLAQLLSTPITDSAGVAHNPKGVLVVFYRGYW
jgi:hypothetical protein